jgi:hypothetical protein
MKHILNGVSRGCTSVIAGSTSRAELSASGSGPVGNVKKIPAANANGDSVTVYAFEDRRFVSKVRNYMLCTGDAVEVAERDTFRVISTGQQLLRLDR